MDDACVVPDGGKTIVILFLDNYDSLTLISLYANNCLFGGASFGRK